MLCPSLDLTSLNSSLCCALHCGYVSHRLCCRHCATMDLLFSSRLCCLSACIYFSRLFGVSASLLCQVLLCVSMDLIFLQTFVDAVSYVSCWLCCASAWVHFSSRICCVSASVYLSPPNLYLSLVLTAGVQVLFLVLSCQLVMRCRLAMEYGKGLITLYMLAIYTCF